MSLWSKIVEAVEALAKGASLSEIFDSFTKPPEKTVAFAIAVIGLGAKIAKADGQVTRDEVAAFREVFYIAPAEEKNAARIFNLARQDVAGFEGYAKSIARMFSDDRDVLCDLLEGLFHVATADGEYHEHEDRFLAEVARIFEIDDRQFRAIRSRSVPDAVCDPYDVLGVSPNDSLEDIHAHWRALVRASHPDQMIARGVPEEAVKVATSRIAALNAAWDAVQRQKEAV